MPIHSLYQDRDDDKVPERYLHMKSVSIQGVYGGNTTASLVLTGSPNWSARAARSDEVWVKVFERSRAGAPLRPHIERLRTIVRTRARTRRRRRPADPAAPVPQAASSRPRPDRLDGPVLPDWLELD